VSLWLGILGLILAATGAALFLAPRHRRLARWMLGVGVAVTLLAILVVVLAVGSEM
jgi:hypothetical protein